jgi:AraC-like DNA-binding protein
MTELIIKKDNYSQVIMNLADQLGTNFAEDCHEYSLEIPNAYGCGTIRGINFQNGIALIQIEAKLKESMALVFNTKQAHPVRYNFCLRGQTVHQFNDKNLHYNLPAFMCSITANKTGKKQKFKLPFQQELRFTSIEINRADYYEKVKCDLDSMPKKLAEILADIKGEKSFLYQGNYSMAISDCLKELHDNEHKGLVRRTFLEAKIFEILTYVTQQYLDDLKPGNEQRVLKRDELDQIKRVREILHEQLAEPPTIVELSKIVGINQQKLKKGFKQMYNTTIKKYVQKIRMEQAKLLLVENSMNIGEIAHQVGYTNRSHFARLFRKEFGILPKDYRYNLKLEMKDRSSVSA